MVKRDLRDALDECLRLLIEEQVTLEGCLSRYPEQAEELRPLLEVAIKVRQVPPPEPRSAAMAAGRERVLRAVAARERQGAWADSASGLWARLEALLGDVRRGMAQRPALAAGWAAAAAVFVVLLVGGLFLLSDAGRTVPQLASLEVHQGLVEVRARGAEGWQLATSGQGVGPGTSIRTAEDTVAVLTFFDGSLTAMEGETEIAVDRLGVPQGGAGRIIILSQKRGRTQHRAETARAPGSRFEVRSPLAVMAVRGTEFAVAVEDDGTTQVAVREGLVEVRGRQGTIQLQPGWATSVAPQQPPSVPYQAPPPEMTLDVFPTRSASEALVATEGVPSEPTEEPRATRTPEPRPTATPVPSTEKPSGALRQTAVPPTETPVLSTAIPKATSEPTDAPAVAATATPDANMPPTRRPEATVAPTATPDENMPPTRRPEPTATPTVSPTVAPTATPTPTPDEDMPPTRRPEATPTATSEAADSASGPLETSPLTTPGDPSEHAAGDQADEVTEPIVSSSGSLETEAETTAEDARDASELQPVGGVTAPPSVRGLLAPWAGLAGLLMTVSAGLVAWGRSR